MMLKDFLTQPISNLFDTYFLQKKGKIRLIKTSVTTLAAAIALATGTQPFEISVTADGANNGKWHYDLVPGTLNKLSNGGISASITYTTKAIAISATRIANTFVIITTDETNNNDKTLYADDGTTLTYLLTIPA